MQYFFHYAIFLKYGMAFSPPHLLFNCPTVDIQQDLSSIYKKKTVEKFNLQYYLEANRSVSLKPKQCSNAVPCPWNASVSLARFHQPLAGFLGQRDAGKVFPASVWFLGQRDAGKVFPASVWFFRPARRWQGFPSLWLVF